MVEIEVRGFVDDIRDLGGIKFIKLNTPNGYVQITIKKKEASKKVIADSDTLTRQSCIVVTGEKKDDPTKKHEFEVLPTSIVVLSMSAVPLPLDPSGKTPADMDTRMHWRPIDLRMPKSRAIFKIQSAILNGFEFFFAGKQFTHVFTPSLMGTPSEGGSELFSVAYFAKEAFLRQDPQLHRELTILGGVEKLFEIGPSWRAELSHTVRHLTEHRTCAAEIAYIKDEYDVMKVEEQAIESVFSYVIKNCPGELETLGVKLQKPKLPFPVLEFPKIYGTLKELGKDVEVGTDYDHEAEELLAKYVKEKHKTDFFFVDKFPYSVKPFYVMKDDKDPTWARSVDLIYDGIEMSSGGQREHRHDVMVKQIGEKGLNQDNFEWFTKYFKYGAPTMGGFSIGIERLTMQMLGLKNIREVVLFARDTERMVP
jgi:aspartyl-tRNA synthetase